MKTLSIVIPNYNNSKYLAQCIESVLGQSYPLEEIVIYDDRSTDDSVKILQEYAKKDPRIRLILATENKGVSVARDTAIRSCKTEYVTTIDADDFFYDNPDIAEKYGLVTCLDGEPIGFVTWDPRNRPEYVEIGHNGIREKYKGNGYGRKQLEEALNRIKSYSGLKRIIVCTNSNLVAPKNYESVGFTLYDRKENMTESAYTGDYLYYEIVLDWR